MAPPSPILSGVSRPYSAALRLEYRQGFNEEVIQKLSK